MTRSNLEGSLILLLALVSGCVSRANFPEPPHEWVDTRVPLSEATPASIEVDYAQERHDRREPRLGLALSGGGTRAGMFAFGVLNGLNDAQVLDKVDIISSVSGGGYPVDWLFARRLDADKEGFDYRLAFADCRPDWWVKYDHDDGGRNLMLLKQGGKGNLGFGTLPPCSESASEEGEQWSGPDDRYRWQAHLARFPDMFRRTPVVFSGSSGGGPTASAIPTFIASFLEILRFPFVPDGYLGGRYEEGISRTWGITPLPRVHNAKEEVHYANAEQDIFGGLYIKPGEHTWAKLRELDSKLRHTAQPLPLWIVNTTVLPKQIDPDERTIFELTPFSYGSEVSGYLSTSKYPDILSEIPASVRASAAAADFQGFGTSYWRKLQWISTAVPAARWGVSVNDHKFGDDVGTIRLSDGGGSDNLGLISLVRRGVRDIILVDAEADIEGRFEGLCWDREVLNKAGYDLEFDMLDQFATLCAQRYAERHGKTTEPKRAYNVSAWNNPIIKGRVVALPGKPQSGKLPEMHIWLVKLAWDQAAVHQALNAKQCETTKYPVSCMLVVYHAHQSNTDTEREKYQLFPHLTTGGATWNASTTLLWAWRELGRSAASQFVMTSEGLTINTRPNTAQGTKQPLIYGASNRQAVSRPASGS